MWRRAGPLRLLCVRAGNSPRCAHSRHLCLPRLARDRTSATHRPTVDVGRTDSLSGRAAPTHTDTAQTRLPPRMHQRRGACFVSLPVTSEAERLSRSGSNAHDAQIAYQRIQGKLRQTSTQIACLDTRRMLADF